jgi:HEAT repeat protein
LKAGFLSGPLKIDWYYESDDVFRRRVALPPNMAFLSKRGEACLLRIVPPNKAQMKKLDDELSSVLWDKQLVAARQLLLTNDPVQLKKLERFATHPFRPLRNAAAQAMSRFGEFSPALKALFYSGTDVEERKFRGKNTILLWRF